MRAEGSFVPPRAETVGEITAGRPFLTFPAEGKIEHIVREMIRHSQGVAGIMAPEAPGYLAGLLTERDILRKIFGTHSETEAQYDARQQHLSIYPGSLLAQDVMTLNPVCLTEDMPIEKALDKIRKHGFRYMPVVKKDDERIITGIVSERELFWHAQERFNRTIRVQGNLLSYFIHEPYGAGMAMDVTQ
jgi:CBS domain-containing protein